MTQGRKDEQNSGDRSWTAQSSKLKAQGLKGGDRVVGNGPHAEIVSVPVNLCTGLKCVRYSINISPVHL